MSDLFDEAIPIRVVLHVNVHRGGGRFDWDGMCQNADTRDLLAMTASPHRLRHQLGPELSRMLLWTHAAVLQAEDEEPVGDPPSALD